MKKEIFEQYAKLKIQAKETAEQLKEMEQDIKDQMDVDTNIKSDYGTFSLSVRTTYAYSDKVVDMTNELKEIKIDEEMTGIADVKSENKILTFRIAK